MFSSRDDLNSYQRFWGLYGLVLAIGTIMHAESFLYGSMRDNKKLHSTESGGTIVRRCIEWLVLHGAVSKKTELFL